MLPRIIEVGHSFKMSQTHSEILLVVTLGRGCASSCKTSPVS